MHAFIHPFIVIRSLQFIHSFIQSVSQSVIVYRSFTYSHKHRHTCVHITYIHAGRAYMIKHV